jgi:hypothetical protein
MIGVAAHVATTMTSPRASPKGLRTSWRPHFKAYHLFYTSIPAVLGALRQHLGADHLHLQADQLVFSTWRCGTITRRSAPAVA